MNAHQLKKSILQYAIEGKLVNQDSSDEPSSELLKRISEQKEQMVKEKIIKKEKSLPPITEEEIPFDIPNTWELVRLKSISTFGNFNQASPEKINNDDWVLDLEEIEKNTGRILEQKSASEKTIKSNKYKFNQNDVLYGKLRPYLNKVTIAPREGYCTTEIFPITLIEGVYPKYIQYVLMSPYFLNYAHSLSYGVKMPRLGTAQIANALIPLPPTNEQLKIVDKVEELFLKIDSYDTYYLALEALKKYFPKDLEKSILQYAIEGKLVSQDTSNEPASELLKRISEQKEQMAKDKIIKKEKALPPITEEEIPFDIPDTWEWVRLKNIGIITSGGTPKTAVPDYWNGNITWITPSDMGKNKNSKHLSASDRVITSQGLSNSSAQLIPKNSIVYSSRAPIGHINIMTTDYATNQGCKSFSPILVDVEYIYYALKVMTPYLQKKASGTTFKEISGTTFGLSLIPLPPLQEQSRIVKAIEKNKSVLDRLNTSDSY